MSNQCEHGQLARVCARCEDRSEIEGLLKDLSSYGVIVKEQDAEIERLRADAERYRQLRDVSTITWRSFQEQWRMTADKCDAAVDALKEQQ